MPNKSLWLTVAGFAGFFIACIYLFGPCGKNKSAFHEIGYNPGAIARQILKEKKDSLTVNLKKLDSVKQSFKKIPDKKIKKWQDSIVEQYSNDSRFLHQVDSAYFVVLDDTSRWQKAHEALRTYIDLDTLLFLDSSYLASPDASNVPVNFYFEIADVKGEEIHKTIELPVKVASNDINFFSRYPGFAIWALMIILFVTCVCMTFVYCFHATDQLVTLADNAGCRQRGIYWISLGISIALMTAFVAGILLTLYDSDAIKNVYFMSDLSSKVRCISIGGYVAAAFCFAGMISVASYARSFIDRIPPETEEQSLIKEEIKNFKTPTDAEWKQLEQKKEEFRLSRLQSVAAMQKRMTDEIEELEKSLQVTIDPGKKTEIENKLSKKRDQSRLFALRLTAVVDDYATLRKIFRGYFYAISLLLALLVFSTGALYAAVDSLAFMQLIKKSLAFPSARPDFVYLYGALHTLLILLFYLPARFHLAVYPVADNGDSSEEEKKTFLKNLGTQMKKIPEVLVATAPLLASLVQWILSLVFGE